MKKKTSLIYLNVFLMLSALFLTSCEKKEFTGLMPDEKATDMRGGLIKLPKINDSLEIKLTKEVKIVEMPKIPNLNVHPKRSSIHTAPSLLMTMEMSDRVSSVLNNGYSLKLLQGRTMIDANGNYAPCHLVAGVNFDPHDGRLIGHMRIETTPVIMPGMTGDYTLEITSASMIYSESTKVVLYSAFVSLTEQSRVNGIIRKKTTPIMYSGNFDIKRITEGPITLELQNI